MQEVPEPQMMYGNQVSQPRPTGTTFPTVPPHSLVAFGLFLRLPGYAEVLLKERKRAQCLLRLVLGVADDGDGGKQLIFLCLMYFRFLNVIKRIHVYIGPHSLFGGKKVLAVIATYCNLFKNTFQRCSM